MDDLFKQTEAVTDKESFLNFLGTLARDHRCNTKEWENLTIDAYLNAIKAWCEDSGTGEPDSLDYRAIAKMLYMGKIYE